MNETPIRVFIADDHSIVREGLAKLMEGSKGVRIVGQCGDGAQVIQEIQRTDPDVAVLDVGMPGLNGLDICSKIAGKPNGMAVVMLSVSSEEHIIARALRNGASGYLLKESAYCELEEAISAVARGELFLGKGISREILAHLRSGASHPVDSLTLREREVLQLVAGGMTCKEVADKLGIAHKTADTHRSNLMRKLDIHNVAELTLFAIRNGFISPRGSGTKEGGDLSPRDPGPEGGVGIGESP